VDARKKEVNHYVEAYRDPSYRMGDGRLRAMTEILKRYRGSFLDVSTGRGELMRVAQTFGFRPIYGTEAVPELCNEQVLNATIDSLPFPDKAFDVVSCIDVIEHILEPDIVLGLKELERVTKGTLLIAAADFPDYRNGVNLHPSARPYREWDALFREVFTGTVEVVGITTTSQVWGVTYGR
jgi:ubiquinone/menaquinone biosynthesis C-methylase UbiE